MNTGALLHAVLMGGLVVLGLNVVMCFVRAAIGPTAFDRIMALDCLTSNVSGAVVLISIDLGTGLFLDFLLVVALLGFVGAVALTAYAERTLGA